MLTDDTRRFPGQQATKRYRGERFSPEHLRELLHRKTMAGERHRANVDRMLRMADTEAAALAHLAQHGHLAIGNFLSAVAELSEHHAARLDELLRVHEHEAIALPTPGLWT